MVVRTHRLTGRVPIPFTGPVILAGLSCVPEEDTMTEPMIADLTPPEAVEPDEVDPAEYIEAEAVAPAETEGTEGLA